MLIRELRLDLPGDMPATAEIHRRDEDANAVYEQLSDGITTADAGVIADDMATMARQTEAAAVHATETAMKTADGL
jgi:hypothetical protein